MGISHVSISKALIKTQEGAQIRGHQELTLHLLREIASQALYQIFRGSSGITYIIRKSGCVKGLRRRQSAFLMLFVVTLG